MGDLAFGDVEVERTVADEHRAIAESMKGTALVRFSSALFREVRYPDVLGCAMRFEDETGEAKQDLLFATIKRPWTMLFAPFTTKVSDYFENDYFAVSPFSTPSLPRAYFRVHPEVLERSSEEHTSGRKSTVTRRERLTRAIADGTARLHVNVAEGPRGPWQPCVSVRLTALVLASQPDRLAFDTFESQRDIHPIGFIHALRRSVYAWSQRARGGATRRRPKMAPPVAFGLATGGQVA